MAEELKKLTDLVERFLCELRWVCQKKPIEEDAEENTQKKKNRAKIQDRKLIG